MTIVFDKRFCESGYAANAASVTDRMEAIMAVLGAEPGFRVVAPQPAGDATLLLAHTPSYVDTVKADAPLYEMATLAAGAAVAAGNLGVSGEPAFACLRPPGHHAARGSAWGYCVFCNMGLALLELRRQGSIGSAFVLDFDAHTGDGTRDVLADWPDCRIVNPYADNSRAYLQEIEDATSGITAVDVVGVCAGFDSYVKDAGHKLTTFDFYQIGALMKRFAARAARHRRFAILEGGYYLPDLGRNVLAFCQGLQ